jgi:predicted GNAT superfamily acetyltransferase
VSSKDSSNIRDLNEPSALEVSCIGVNRVFYKLTQAIACKRDGKLINFKMSALAMSTKGLSRYSKRSRRES